MMDPHHDADFAARTNRDEVARLTARVAELEAARIYSNRIERDEKGRLDEVVTDGGAHLERMSKKGWFLSMARADGSAFCVWFHGKITMEEDREPPLSHSALAQGQGE